MNWKDEYAEILRTNPLDISTLSRLALAHFPTPIYKYRSFDRKGYWKDWLDGKIFAASPQTFNDPFDCNSTFDKDTCSMLLKEISDFMSTQYPVHSVSATARISDAPADAKRSITKKENKKVQIIAPDIFRNYEMLQKELDVTCFSRVNNSTLMWSHYAANHTGYCIGFDFSGCPEMRAYTFPVSYSAARPILTCDDLRYGRWPYLVALAVAMELLYHAPGLVKQVC